MHLAFPGAPTASFCPALCWPLPDGGGGGGRPTRELCLPVWVGRPRMRQDHGPVVPVLPWPPRPL